MRSIFKRFGWSDRPDRTNDNPVQLLEAGNIQALLTSVNARHFYFFTKCLNSNGSEFSFLYVRTQKLLAKHSIGHPLVSKNVFIEC